MLNLLKSITTSLVQVGFLLPLLLLITRNYSKKQKYLLVLAALVLISDGIIASGVDFTIFPSQRWNWTGKSASLIAAMLFIYFNPILSNNDIGFTSYFKPSVLFSVLLVGGIALFLRLMLKIISKDFHSFNIETFAFQVTLPGFCEEVIYRGILLGLLNQIYQPVITIFKAKIGWGFLIVSVVFGLVHGITLNKLWQISFNSQRCCMTMGLGLILAWLNQRSGSLLPSVVFHNLWNLIVFS